MMFIHMYQQGVLFLGTSNEILFYLVVYQHGYTCSNVTFGNL